MNAELSLQILQLLASNYMLCFIHGKYGNNSTRKFLTNQSDSVWYQMDRKKLNNALARYHANGFIEYVDRDNVLEFSITNKGRQKLLLKQFNCMELHKDRKWDKQWRMVAFDIPETIKFSRDTLRRKLKKVGFIEFQKSLFAYPYECQNEVNFIINFLGVTDYVYLITAKIDPDTKLRKHFSLN